MLDFGYYNMDCMDGMKLFPDKHFDIAVVDPPYFSGPEKRNYYGRAVSPIGVQRHYKPSDEWNVPDKAYFEELARVSKNQIIWVCNYFDYSFGSGRIVWDKYNGESSFSDCEKENPRLTAKDSQGYWSLKGVLWESLCEGQVITKNIQQRLTGALCKLKDYEDTGYSPENVEHLRYILEDAVKELEKCQGQTELTKEIWHYLRAY